MSDNRPFFSVPDLFVVSCGMGMIPAIGFLFEIGRELVTDWRAGRENKRKIKSAVAENKARLAINEQTHNNKWEMMQLENKDELLQRTSFFFYLRRL